MTLEPVVTHKTDWKNPPRVRDANVFREFHAQGLDCLSCGHGCVVEAHHLIHRSQGGDDVLANLIALCQECHRAYHGTPYTAFGVKIDAKHVRHALARYLRSEDGEDASWYVTGKLGADAAVAFIERLEA